MQSTHWLSLLPDPLWSEVAASDGVYIYMGQIEQTMCVNKWRMLNCDSYIAILETCAQKKAQPRLRMLSTKCVYKSYVFDIYVYAGFGIKLPTAVDMP